MTFARPFYAARVEGSPDVPVSVRKDSGQIVLDSSRAPHVDGTLTLSVPDVALLEDLDPRDARRLVLDVYPDSHLSALYSAWVEQLRNLALGVPGTISAARTNGVSWGGDTWYQFNSNSGTATAGGMRHTIAGLTNGSTYTFVAEVANPGVSPITLDRISFSDLNLNAVTLQPGERRTVTATGTRANYSGLNFADVRAPTGTVFLLRLSTVLIGTVPNAVPFDGASNPSGTLERTRWIGTANASASVIETRSLTGWEQIPDGTPRTFDLGIREATPERGAGTVALQLASDEALLDDFAQLADDKGARAYQASLRAVVNYVLGKIGAALEPGGADADVTAYWAITNLLSNPSFEVDAAGWVPGTGASAVTRVANASVVGSWVGRWTAAAGVSNCVPMVNANSFYTVKPGEWYVFAFYLASGTARQARAAIQWWSQGGAFPSATSEGTLTSSIPASFTRMWVIAQCPPGADRAVPFVNTIGNASGDVHLVDGAMFYAGDELVPYSDGSTPATAFYTYAWQAAPHASTSTRTPIIDRPPAGFTWRAGVSGLAFLANLVQAAGFRLVCNERREWSLRAGDYREGGGQVFREGVNIVAASEQLSRSAEEWYDGAVFTYTWTDDDGIEQTRVDAFALPGATKVIRRDISAPYPGPGRAEYAVGRAQGRGRTITATRQPDWTEAAEQTFSALLEGTEIQVGTADRVVFDIGGNTVTSTSRTTDTPASAWVLIPAGEKWTDSPVGGSWIGEII